MAVNRRELPQLLQLLGVLAGARWMGNAHMAYAQYATPNILGLAGLKTVGGTSWSDGGARPGVTVSLSTQEPFVWDYNVSASCASSASCAAQTTFLWTTGNLTVIRLIRSPAETALFGPFPVLRFHISGACGANTDGCAHTPRVALFGTPNGPPCRS